MNEILKEQEFPHGQVLQLVQGDITEEEVEAIVNAANARLQHGGGVAAAISRKGGPEIQKESNAWVRLHGPVRHSEPAYTTGGELPCKYVIHAVGPVWGEGHESSKLISAVKGCLQLAEELKLSSIAFPAISTGIFGFPKKRAARLIFQTVSETLNKKPENGLKLVRVVLFDNATSQAFLQVWEEGLSQSKGN